VEFASAEGKRLFAEAMQGGTMEGFFNLISYFQTQSEPAFCGLASLSVVLNALAIDPGRTWKGPWRWFDESMLDCCEPLVKVKADGITFGNVCLAHCAGARVQSFRADQTTIHDFRAHLKRCASSQDCHLISSYHRRPFLQVSISPSASFPPNPLRFTCARGCRLGLAISHRSGAITPGKTWPSSWMSRASNTLLIGFRCRSFGKP
jgi:hypothetical protein